MDGIRRSAGIDWAQDRHAVCVVDERGIAVSRFEVEHTAIGLRELVGRLEGVDGVAIERPDGPVAEALLEAGIPIVVIASRQVRALRTRHGLAGNKERERSLHPRVVARYRAAELQAVMSWGSVHSNSSTPLVQMGMPNPVVALGSESSSSKPM